MASVEEALGGPVDFCRTLERFKKVEDTTGYNWFNRWGWASSTMFIATTISTIGYGNLVPRTPYGKILTMVTAVGEGHEGGAKLCPTPSARR